MQELKQGDIAVYNYCVSFIDLLGQRGRAGKLYLMKLLAIRLSYQKTIASRWLCPRGT
jgi:hypothetical protein